MKDVKLLSPERKLIAKTFNKHINDAIAELQGYTVDVQGDYFSKKSIKIEIEITARDEIP